MIYRFRIIWDHEEEDVFRDIEIESTDTLEDFHNAIIQAFGFDGSEMASFFKANDQWEEGEEISLFDLGENPGETRVMNETLIEDVFSREETKMIYTYDFLLMWTFLVELADIVEREEGQSYPNLMFVHGQIPFDMDDDDDDFYMEEFEDFEEEDDDFDLFDDMDLDQNYDDLGFDENWN